MSKIRNVPIRSIQYLSNHKDALTALKSITGRIPIYYQYCQKRMPLSKIPEENKIGEAKNVRVDGDMLVCDVVLFDLNKYASQFDNKIDNYVMAVNKATDGYDVHRFIIYNKDFKRKVDKKMENENNNENEQMSVCMEIAGAESIPELHKETPKAE